MLGAYHWINGSDIATIPQTNLDTFFRESFAILPSILCLHRPRERQWSSTRSEESRTSCAIQHWKEVAFPLLLTIVFGVATAYFLLFHTLPRQKDWLDDKNVPEQLAEMLAVCIVVTEVFVSTIIYDAVCVDYFQDKIFAFVLRDRGLGDLLHGREQRSTAVKMCTSYYLSRSVLGFISLPLHLVPVFGSLLYAWLHGGVMAWEQHIFYFELKGFGLRQQQRWIRRYKLQYSSFGVHQHLWGCMTGRGFGARCQWRQAN